MAYGMETMFPLNTQEHTMQLPPTDPETFCADLWPDLPPETGALARACKACGRAQQVHTPQQRLRVVVCSGGRETSLRDTAADCTLLDASMPDAALAERWAACRPWGQAVWAKRLPPQAVSTLPAPWRVLVIAGRHGHGPGAQGRQARRPSWRAVVP